MTPLPQHARRRHLAVTLASTVALSLLTVAPPAFAAADDPVRTDFDAVPGGEPFFTAQQLATNGEEGFPNYRIPALTVTTDGDLLASYDGRPTEDDSPGPNSVLQRRSTDNGQTWQDTEVIAAGQTDEPIYGYSDPSYIVDRHTGDIFNFHVFSMDKGFIDSKPGTDVADRNVIHANVARSTDNGQSWASETITAAITPDRSWRSRFAASGQGIQLQYGPHRGRLIQQFTVMTGPSFLPFKAVSVYSDDHGQTWQAGELVGRNMDENKVVELSDGRVMLNSRDSGKSGYRKVAYSEDGGHSYGEVRLEKQLPDPANNASIIRAYPNAPQGSDDAKVLLFSNAADKNSRSNGTVRMSCDDGQTWPVSKVFEPGAMDYSTMATLPDGNIGMLFERGPSAGISFAKFNLAWLDGVCASIAVPDVDLTAGTAADIQINVTNHAGTALENGTIELELPSGWGYDTLSGIELTAGEMQTFTIKIDVPPETYGGEFPMGILLTTPNGTARSTAVLNVNGPDFPLSIYAELRNPKGQYSVGDVLKFSYTLVSSAEIAVDVDSTSPDLKNFSRPGTACSWANLPAKDRYTCNFPSHTVTADDLAAGEFTPRTMWLIDSVGSENRLGTISHDGPTVRLVDPPTAAVTKVPDVEIPVGATKEAAVAAHARSPQ